MQIPTFPFLLIDTSAEHADELAAELFELGAGGVEERDQSTLVKSRTPERVTLSASFEQRAEAEQALSALDGDVRAHAPETVEIIGDAWRDAWKEHFKPFVLTTRPSDGVRVAVRPPWVSEAEAKAQLGELERTLWLELEPGRAFGTGLHETTQLVSRALGTLPLHGQPVLDVGTGSGILALIALVLGAERVRGTDNDPEAIEVSLENAERNGLTARSEFDTTDVAEEQAAAWPFVLANIETHILVPMAKSLAGTVQPGGHLLLSGILATQEPQILDAYLPLGMQHVETKAQGEWVLVHLQRGA